MEHGKQRRAVGLHPLSQSRMALGLPHRRMPTDQMFWEIKVAAHCILRSRVRTHTPAPPQRLVMLSVSLQDIFLPFLCLLSKPPFRLWHSLQPGPRQQGKALFAPTNRIQRQGVSLECLTGFPPCFPASGICCFLGGRHRDPSPRECCGWTSHPTRL